MTIRLRLNMADGSFHEGSSDPVSKRADSGTSYGGFSEKDLASIQPYSNYGAFLEACKSEKYKGNVHDPRAGEAYREECAKRLAKMEQVAALGQALTAASQDTASAIVQADPSINPNIARVGVQHGPFRSREERANAYADPRYATSQDFRDLVISRDALTEL